MLSLTGTGFAHKQLVIHYTKTEGGECIFGQLMDGQPTPPILTAPTASQQPDSFHLPPVSVPRLLDCSSAPCIEPTFEEIVYQLHSVDRLIPNPGTTLQLPWTIAQYTTVEECTVWPPFSEDNTESQTGHMTWPRSHSECWVKERAYMAIPEPILFLTTRLDGSLASLLTFHNTE